MNANAKAELQRAAFAGLFYPFLDTFSRSKLRKDLEQDAFHAEDDIASRVTTGRIARWTVDWRLFPDCALFSADIEFRDAGFGRWAFSQAYREEDTQISLSWAQSRSKTFHYGTTESSYVLPVLKDDVFGGLWTTTRQAIFLYCRNNQIPLYGMNAALLQLPR